ncbi:M55 family metallopeptidase [Limnochorda pilosa]|uniref:D-aminopeptidase n=1 Tax=Limnochorda pilosa TaxID=1555112 RepID=A0A0K2SH42_LIMPI|nr:M55 family metallopeptidase [Limnochorda pilosa]BAS26436.1 D-aminopeptidase [Limnochorda pilosa]
MKVYVSVDMEGVAGVASWPQVEPKDPAYALAREWMIEETNAAVEGAVEAGATEILVNDSHDGMRNLPLDRLRPPARLITGSLKPLSMMAGLDASFDAVLFVGYHARGGSEGTLAHTWSSSVTGVRLNGLEVGEWGLNAMIAGHFGVPVVLVTGDDRLAEEVREGLPGAERVVVKQALSRYAALSLPREEATAAIRRGAAQGVARARSVAPFRPSLPIRLEVDFGSPERADEAATLPRAERLGALSVAYTAADAMEAWRAFYSFMALAAYAS